MFFNLLFLAAIFILFILVSKRNFKERMDELKNNLSTFNEDIKNYFCSLPLDTQQKFIETEDTILVDNLKRLLENKFIYGRNVWSIQQQIAEMQELFKKIKDLK